MPGAEKEAQRRGAEGSQQEQGRLFMYPREERHHGRKPELRRV
jgi:hypothetical protein